MNFVLKLSKSSLLLLILASMPLVYGQQIPVYESTPRFYEFLPNAFSDVAPMLKNLNPMDHPIEYAGILGASAVLIYYDQPIIDKSQEYAHRIHLISETDQGGQSRRVWTTKIGLVNADFRLPKGPNSYMYYIGDGITSLTILSGLLLYGNINSDLRSLNTASQLMESLTLTGMFVITGKYTSGRESPFRRSRPGGAWHPAPGITNYLTAISQHDAFPSGHVATVTATFTILQQNYPEKTWIFPVEIGALSMLMFAMMNNGVHWAGDYPVGIAIGYVAAKTVYEQRKPQTTSEKSAQRRMLPKHEFMPFSNEDGFGLSYQLTL